MRLQAPTLFAALAGIAIIAGIVVGLIIIGWPSDVRMRRFDEIRAGDLQAISTSVETYRRTHESLPRKLEDLAPSSGAYSLLRLRDPADRPYEYAVKAAFSYELCAEFDKATDEPTRTSRYRSIFSKHGRGRQCFDLEARPSPQH